LVWQNGGVSAAEELAAALRRIPLFAALPAPLLDEIVRMTTTATVERGQVLFDEGEPAAFLPLLLAGRVKLFRAGPDGREQVLHLVRAPASFAEAAVFGPGVFPATAAGVDTSRVAKVSRLPLLDLLRRRPEVALGILASLSIWMRRLVQLVDGLALHSVEERVAAYLWSAFSRSGGTLLPGAQIRLEDPKYLIAALCGTAPEVLSRTFKRLSAAGVLRVDGPVATILDPAALAARAHAGGVAADLGP